jgi:hypothetical protein
VNATSIAARDECVARGGKDKNKRRSSNGSILVFVLLFLAAACALQYFMSTGQQPHSVLLRTYLVLLKALSLNQTLSYL